MNRRTLLGTLAAMSGGVSGCMGSRADESTPTPGKRLRLRVLNFDDEPVTVVVSLAQGGAKFYEKTVALDGATGNEMTAFTDHVRVERAVPCTISGRRNGEDGAVSKTVRYEELQTGYNLIVEEDGALELWDAI